MRPDAWGLGYGTETFRLLLSCAFQDLSLHRVWGARAPLNQASALTMARAGFSEKGPSASTSTSPDSIGTLSPTRSSTTNGKASL
ncbi:GNAT family N-acetyltransferase [Streptomyces sp. NBC_00683]|uniref:GNAT family N-acetyltransferase n=1 Tax=Streptomyces sp. NBC_00683 TaxID=2903670 RepID=UPI002E335452|nr:GNAT family N-acetyltransferase [Streptomyces sp. NBC_00683]